MDSVQISQLGKVVGNKVKLGEFRRIPAGDGKFTAEFRMTRKSVPLGDGVELAPDMPPSNNTVWLNVTAEAAKRHGWDHPANKPRPGPEAIPGLRAIFGNDNFGQQERLAAWRQIGEIDPTLAQALRLTCTWLFEGVA